MSNFTAPPQKKQKQNKNKNKKAARSYYHLPALERSLKRSDVSACQPHASDLTWFHTPFQNKLISYYLYWILEPWTT